jgi:hypothetical protein
MKKRFSVASIKVLRLWAHSMKFGLYVIAAFTFTTLQGVALGDDKRAEETSFKGIELYSWKDKEGNWLFVLACGTNFQKDEMSVKAEEKIKGTAELKKALALLAKGEHVGWSDHRLTGFEFPPEETRNEIKKAAKKAKIDLSIDLDSSIEPSLINDKVSISLDEECAIAFKRDGDQLQQPTKVKAAETKKALVTIKLGKTEASPLPPPRKGATRPFLSVNNNFDKTLSIRVLVRMKDPNNRYHASFEKLSNDMISLPAGESINHCWDFDALVEEVILYDFKLSDTQAK